MDKRNLNFLTLLYFLFMLSSCRTTSSGFGYKEPPLLCEEELTDLGTEDEKYIFLRFYVPDYNNPLCIENTLKNLIQFVDVNPIKYSHVAIGFDLNDKFLGLTTAGSRDLKIEQCTNIKANPYMKKCNPKKSIQTTYAIKVNDYEYNKAKAIAQYFYDENIEYSISKNFTIGLFEIKRKFYTSKEQQVISNIFLKMEHVESREIQESFMCSSFVSYVLINSVEKIKVFFEQMNLDYNLIMPSDLVSVPYMKKLFSSTWNDYIVSAKAFVKENWLCE